MVRTEAEFDKYDKEYKALVEDAIGFSGIQHEYVTKVKADLIVEVAIDRWKSTESRRILDVGCGVGLTDELIAQESWEVFGSDISENSLLRARERNPDVEYRLGTEDSLPFEDNFFDMCFTICVMHHVLPEQWRGFIAEMNRVTKPGGLVMILEHNPLNPLTRMVVNRCPFDENAVLLGRRQLMSLMRDAGLRPLETRYFLFTPWERLSFVEKYLKAIPLGAQYYLLAEATR